MPKKLLIKNCVPQFQNRTKFKFGIVFVLKKLILNEKSWNSANIWMKSLRFTKARNK